MSTVTDLGRRVRELRARKGWTLEQLAKEAGVSKGFLSAVENNHNQPSGRVLLHLAQALGASVDYLVQGESAGVTGSDTASGAPRVVEIPEELAALAERENWPFAKVTAVLNARMAVHAKRSDRPRRPFTTSEWIEFAELLAPYLDREESK
jgi:transcriptional regulator with XRE-family HTH domain